MTTIKTHFPIFKERSCRKCRISGLLLKPMWVVYDDKFSVMINGAIFRKRMYVCKKCLSTKQKALAIIPFPPLLVWPTIPLSQNK